jgi:hypothetical protein
MKLDDGYVVVGAVNVQRQLKRTRCAAKDGLIRARRQFAPMEATNSSVMNTQYVGYQNEILV